MPTSGYTGKVLRADLTTQSVGTVDTSEHTGRFMGGKGLAASIYWHEVPPEVGAFDPANKLVFASGPLCGLPVLAGSRWEVCGKSPGPPEGFNYANLGGRWGATLKFAGYDGVVVQGASESPVYLLIDDGRVEFRDAATLWQQGAIQTRELLKRELGASVSVVAIGPAGENMAAMASLLADGNASGSGGLGGVMGSKKLKAIAVRGSGGRIAPARPEYFQELATRYRQLARSFPSTGWEYLSRWSRDPIGDPRIMPGPEMKKEPCYGCLGNCARKVYQGADGKKGKFLCHSAFFYQPYTDRYYGDWSDVAFFATRLCDDYGIDAVAIDLMINWLLRCHQAGVVSEQDSNIPFSKVGSPEFIECLIKRVALREGIGNILARGIGPAAQALGPGAQELAAGAGYLGEAGYHPYDPRLYLANALSYAMEPRMPIQMLHEIGLLMAKWAACVKGLTPISSQVVKDIAIKFWGGEAAADFSTYEGKALAAKKIQDRGYADESLILCNFLWPMTDCDQSPDLTGDPSWESRIISAVLGKDISEEDLYRTGERIFNLQRAIRVREGHRGRDFDRLDDHYHTSPLAYDQANADCLVPGPNGEALSRIGETVDRRQFEKLKDDYYALRGWDVATGLQTRKTLEDLDLKDVAAGLEDKGLLSSC